MGLGPELAEMRVKGKRQLFKGRAGINPGGLQTGREVTKQELWRWFLPLLQDRMLWRDGVTPGNT